MTRELEDKQILIDVNNSYELTFVTLVKNIKLSIAHQQIKECLSSLLKSGYSKKELSQYMSLHLKDK